MIRKQFERLHKMHGLLFPVDYTKGLSHVRLVRYSQDYMEKSLENPVKSDTVLTFFVGSDIDELGFLFPLTALIGFLDFNGTLVGFSGQEVDDRIRRSYARCEWASTEEDQADSFSGNIGPFLSRYEKSINAFKQDVRHWFLLENRSLSGRTVYLKELFDLLRSGSEKGMQILPTCLNVSAS